MLEHDQGKFARKAQRILHREQPRSLADLMHEESTPPESRDLVFPGTRQPGNTVREEFRLPEDLAELLREYAHQHRQKKTAVVIEALHDFFRHRHFTVSRRERSS